MRSVLAQSSEAEASEHPFREQRVPRRCRGPVYMFSKLWPPTRLNVVRVIAGLSASGWHHRAIGTDPRCSWRSMSSRNASTILLTNFKQIFGTGEMLPLSPGIPPLPRVQIDALHGCTSWSQRQYRPANPVDLRRLPDPVHDEQSSMTRRTSSEARNHRSEPEKRQLRTPSMEKGSGRP